LRLIREGAAVSAAADIPALYDAAARQYDRDRSRAFFERPYLERVVADLAPEAEVLDLGCGSGEPIARFLIEAGCRVTGVDVAPAMLALCRGRFPAATWLEHDMRTLALGRRFAAIIAWNSFFHLPQDDQRRMFAVFERHAAPGAALLFTSGTGEGVTIGTLYGRPLFHASLDTTEYRRLLQTHGFAVSLHRVADPDCGEHTVWLARYRGAGSLRSSDQE
jgi:SAM-dependent methyltransferase